MITTLDVETTFDVDADNKITSSPFNGSSRSSNSGSIRTSVLFFGAVTR